MRYQEAREWCRGQGAELSTIVDQQEKELIVQLAEEEGYNGDVWFGLDRLEHRDGPLRFPDGRTPTWTDWETEQPSNDTNMRCVASRVSPRDNCFQHKVNISVIEGLLDKPSDASPPNTFQFGYRTTDDLDWCEGECARESNCWAWTFIKNSEPNGIWKGECVGRSNFQKVQEPHPHGYSGIREDCAIEGYWRLFNCGITKGFVCKKPPGSNIPVTTQAPDSVSGFCPAGYADAGNNKCLKSFILPQDEGKTWSEAVNLCRAEPGLHPDLAAFKTLQENALITQQLRDTDYGLWIGVYRDAPSSDWVWSDNSLLSFTNWGPNEPTGNDNCGEIWINPGPTGTWNNINCDDKRSYVCQTFKDKNNIIPTGSLTTTHTCSGEYKPYNRDCYKPVQSVLRREEAESMCLGDGGHLASIHSEAENAAVFTMATDSFPIWIGLKKDEDGEFRWSDNWPDVYTNWNSGEPGDGECVVMDINGKWNSTQCSDSLKSLCKTTQVPVPTTPTRPPGYCLDEWEEFGSSCYYFATKPYWPDYHLKTWQDALDACKEWGGKTHDATLASVTREEENEFIRNRVEELNPWNSDKVWLGLSRSGKDSPFKWTDNSPVNYLPWAPGEPNGNDQDSQCVEMYVKNFKGKWNDEDCNQQTLFVCKSNRAPDPTTPTMPEQVPGDCPSSDWKHWGQYCYLFRPDERQSWFNATAKCKSEDPNAMLVTVNSGAVSWFVRDQLVAASDLPVVSEAWIGFKKEGKDAPYMWSDRTPVEYLNWAPGEPNDQDGTENCVEMYSNTGEWNDYFCDEERGYICQLKKESYSSTVGMTATPTSGSWHHDKMTRLKVVCAVGVVVILLLW